MFIPRRVLVVCLGNICRSPIGQVVLQQAINQKIAHQPLHSSKNHCSKNHLIQVDSAGTANYHVDNVADSRSITIAKKNGYDLTSHRAQQITINDFKNYDLILAMDNANLKAILTLKAEYNSAAQLESNSDDQSLSKTPCLANVALYSDVEIPDPYYGTTTDFENVLLLCQTAALKWVDRWQL